MRSGNDGEDWLFRKLCRTASRGREYLAFVILVAAIAVLAITDLIFVCKFVCIINSKEQPQSISEILAGLQPRDFSDGLTNSAEIPHTFV